MTRLPSLQSPFPSFLAECAFRDGQRDNRDGTPGANLCAHHGPVAVIWYRAGFNAGPANA